MIGVLLCSVMAITITSMPAGTSSPSSRLCRLANEVCDAPQCSQRGEGDV